MEVLDCIRKNQPISKTELSALTGFSRIKIAKCITYLVDRNYITFVGKGSSSGGRKPRLLAMNNQLAYVIGVDMGATSVDIAVAELTGNILNQRSLTIDVREGPESVLSSICSTAVEQLVEINLSPASVNSIGIGVPGPVDFINGVLVSPPLMPLWDSFSIRTYFKNTFPHARVTVDNDVNVMALGEFSVGVGKGKRNMIFVKIGTGIGAGIICNGYVYRGSSGCAGDIGHICADRQGPVCRCGNIGCLEAMVGGPAIASLALECAKTGKSPLLARIMESKNGLLTCEDVGRAAAEGDSSSFEIIRYSGRMIGDVLASLVNFFNPDLIVIGGGVSNIGYQLLSSIRQAVLNRSLPLSTRDLQIVYSSLGARAGVVGAINLAIDNLFIVAA